MGFKGTEWCISMRMSIITHNPYCAARDMSILYRVLTYVQSDNVILHSPWRFIKNVIFC